MWPRLLLVPGFCKTLLPFVLLTISDRVQCFVYRVYRVFTGVRALRWGYDVMCNAGILELLQTGFLLS